MQESIIDKFAIRNGFSMKIINEPNYYFNILGKLPENVSLKSKLNEPVDLIHLFTRSRKELMVELPALKEYINHDGAIIISWPRNSSGFVSDLTDDFIVSIGAANGLKPAGEYDFHNEWSALKFTRSTGGN